MASPKRAPTRKPTSSSNVRVVVLAVALGWFIQKLIKPYLLPYGPADPGDLARVDLPKVDTGNDILRAKYGKLQKIFERVEPGNTPLIKSPETIIFDSRGIMHAFTVDAKLVKLTDMEPLNDGVTIMATATEVAHIGVGRPLSGAFHPADGSLYITDVHLGLLRLKPKTKLGSDFAKVELIASRVLDDHGRWSPLRYVNDVAIGPKTGRVYFSDASEIAPERESLNGHWDGMYAAKLDCLRGKRTGRLLMYDPQTDEVSLLAQNLTFANGVAVVDAEETSVVVSETFAPGLQRLDLATGQLHPVVGLPGYPDGVDCSWTTGLCYAAMPTSILSLHRLFQSLPHPIETVFRTLVMTFPKWLAPPVQHYGGLAEFDPTTGVVQRIIQDPTAADIGLLTGVTVKDQKLYLGSLANNFIGVYDLSK